VARLSAGLLLYRRSPGGDLEVLCVHPGGPLWRRRDAGAWSIPKGEVEGDDAFLSTAEREFAEELGTPPPPGPRLDLGEVTQRGGKRVRAFAVAGDLDPDTVRSAPVSLEWPRGSGRVLTFPEIDRAAWFSLATARAKLLEAQATFVDRLAAALGEAPTGGGS